MICFDKTNLHKFKVKKRLSWFKLINKLFTEIKKKSRTTSRTMQLNL